MSQIEQAVTILIQATEVVRDKNGWWSHPGIPDFDESAERYNAWKAEQGIETKYVELESEDDDHPVYVAYFENADTNISQWNPAPPAGDGWFTLSIHETEDGPIWVWARRAGAAALPTTAAQIAACDSDPDLGRANLSEGAKT